MTYPLENPDRHFNTLEAWSCSEMTENDGFYVIWGWNNGQNTINPFGSDNFLVREVLRIIVLKTKDRKYYRSCVIKLLLVCD